MNARKLTEAIADLRKQRDDAVAVVDQAIEQLEKIANTLQATTIETIPDSSAEHADASDRTINPRSGSHLDNVIKVLEASGKPMHVVELTERVTEMSGQGATRGSLEGAISADIRDSKHPLLVRVSAGIYGLSSWASNGTTTSSHVRTAFRKHKRKSRTRMASLAEYIRTNGPKTRMELITGTGMPRGTIATCLNDKNQFRRLPDGRWELATPEVVVPVH